MKEGLQRVKTCHMTSGLAATCIAAVNALDWRADNLDLSLSFLTTDMYGEFHLNGIRIFN